MQNKEHKFVIFLLGMFAGRYGIPIGTHILYWGVIIILSIKAFVK